MIAESIGKIKLIAVAAFLGDFLDGQPGVLQQLQCIFHPVFGQITDRRGIHIMFELPLERTASATCGIADFLQCQTLGQLQADERDRPLQLLGIGLLNRTMGKQQEHLINLRTVFPDISLIFFLGHFPQRCEQTVKFGISEIVQDAYLVQIHPGQVVAQNQAADAEIMFQLTAGLELLSAGAGRFYGTMAKYLMASK